MGNVFSYVCSGAAGEKLLQSCADGDILAVKEIIEAASRQRHFESSKEAQAAARALQSLLDTRNSLGQTALMLACRHGRTDVVKLLLAQGANPLLTDTVQHKSCLHHAAQVGWATCCAVLLSDATFYRATGQLLRDVEVRGRDGRMRKYIDLDSQQGCTALHVAASHSHLETTKVLLKAGASLLYECQGHLRTPASQALRIPRMSRAHITPLHLAAARRNVPMCRAMLQAHAAFVASSESAVGGGQPAYDIRNTRDHFEQRPVDIAEALNCAPLAAMLNPQLALHLATAGHGFQGPLGPQPLADLAAKALRKGLIAQLNMLAKSAEARHPGPGQKQVQARAAALLLVDSLQQVTLSQQDRRTAGSEQQEGRTISDLLEAWQENCQHISHSLVSSSGHRSEEARTTLSRGAAVASGAVPRRRTAPYAVVSEPGEAALFAATSWQAVRRSVSLDQARLLALGITSMATSCTSHHWQPDRAVPGLEEKSQGGEPSQQPVRIRCVASLDGQCDSLQPTKSTDCHSSLVDPSECGICLDSVAGLLIQGCGHALCTSCAVKLCGGTSCSPPVCPFCRCWMAGFAMRKSC